MHVSAVLLRRLLHARWPMRHAAQVCSKGLHRDVGVCMVPLLEDPVTDPVDLVGRRIEVELWEYERAP